MSMFVEVPSAEGTNRLVNKNNVREIRVDSNLQNENDPLFVVSLFFKGSSVCENFEFYTEDSFRYFIENFYTDEFK